MSVAQSPETQIIRLSPSAFPELPPNLIEELQRRQCTIPQDWNGPEKNPAAFASGEDSGYVQFIGRDQWGYSRGIGPVGKDFMMRHYDAHGGPKPPPIDHLGIEDVFIEKASVVWYFYNGQWLKLTGAD